MNPDLVREVETLRNEFDDRSKPEIFSAVIDQFLSTPGLVGFWPMSSVQRSAGNAYDLSAQGRTLTYNGNPTYNIYNDFVPYIDLDGTGDYLSRADETDLDITGTETHNASNVRGFTCGGWYYPLTTAVGQKSFASKWDDGTAAPRYSWVIDRNTNDFVRFIVATDATTGASSAVISSGAINLNNWTFLVNRLIPSTSQDIFLNDVKTSKTTAVPASLFNVNSSLKIGAKNAAAQLFDGYISLWFLSANALPDTYINTLYEQSRILFGV